MPTEPCNIHGEPRARLAHDLPSEWPRAALAVDTRQVQSVIVKGPALIAENDPYNSVKSTVKPRADTETPKPESKAEETTMPDPTKPIFRAEPVTPEEKAAAEERPVEIRRAIPVNPSDKAQTTPTNEPDETSDSDN